MANLRPQLFVVAVAVVLLTVACRGSSDDTENEELRAQIAALQAQVDEAENDSELEQRLKLLEEQLTAPEVRATPPEASATPAQVPVEPTAVAVALRTRYVANTDGDGVSVRSACRDSARTGAPGWPESAVVRVEYLGTGECTGWVLARLDTGNAASWIRDRYLSETEPVVARPTSSPEPT